MDIQVLDPNPLYLNQTYRLRFRFSKNYPIGPSFPPPNLFFPHPKNPHTHPFSNPQKLTHSSPAEPPEVIFLHLTPTSPPSTTTPSSTTLHSQPVIRQIPIHPHIYSNGIICLDLLGSAGWSPVQNVESVCMSLQSMLTGNTKNERPPGDEDFVRMNTQRPRDIRFEYHDNDC